MAIVVVVALVSWLALGVLAVGLLGVAKMLVRFTARAKADAAVDSGATNRSFVDGREDVGRSFAAQPPHRPGAAALPSPSSRRPG